MEKRRYYGGGEKEKGVKVSVPVYALLAKRYVYNCPRLTIITKKKKYNVQVVALTV